MVVFLLFLVNMNVGGPGIIPMRNDSEIILDRPPWSRGKVVDYDSRGHGFRIPACPSKY